MTPKTKEFGVLKLGKLAKLRGWLTVPELASSLSISLGEEVDQAAVLRLGLDGHLVISVRFVGVTFARLVGLRNKSTVPGSKLEADRDLREAREAMFDARLIDNAPKSLWESTTVAPLPDGVYDLPMIGAERADIERQYRHLTSGPAANRASALPPFVDSTDGLRFALQGRALQEAFWGDIAPDAQYLPDDAVLVIRLSSLPRLERFLVDAPEAPDSSRGEVVGLRERTTLYTIIAALAAEAKVDITRPSKAGGAIEAMTETLGARVSARTIEEHLKRVTETLESPRKPSK